MPFVAFDLYGINNDTLQSVLLILLIDTLYTFDRVIVRLQEVFGNDMKSLQDPSECKKLFRYWYQWALHDYVACSHAGTYTPLLTVLKETLARALKCYFADEYDQDALVADSSQIQTVMKSFDELELDPKAIEAFQLIHEQQQKSDVKWDIWVLSSIGYNDTAKLISRQDLLNSYIADSNIHCCDDLKVSKPHPKVYSELMRQAVHNTKRIEVKRRGRDFYSY